MNPSAILVGIAAGLASGLLFAGIAFQSSSAFWLAFAVPIPVAIASLGWGTAAGFIAAFTAAGLLYAATGLPVTALTLLLAVTLPTAVAGHLAGLSRPAGDETAPPAAAAPRLDWYPLPRILQAIALMSVAACIAVGWLIGFDPASLGAEIAGPLGEALAASGAVGPGLTAEQITQVAQFLIDLVPIVQPAVVVTMLATGLYLGAWAARISGRLPRPRDDIPASARLPRAAVGLFAAGLIGSFAPGTAGILASVLAGAYLAAFTLVGLASFHRRTRGTGGRGLILTAAYGSIVILAVPLFAFTVLGVLDAGRRPAGAAGPPAD